MKEKVSQKWRNWYRNEVDEEIKRVDSRDTVSEPELTCCPLTFFLLLFQARASSWNRQKLFVSYPLYQYTHHVIIYERCSLRMVTFV